MHRSNSSLSKAALAVLLSLAVGCIGQEGGAAEADLNDISQDAQKAAARPRVTATSPIAGATNVALDAQISATFSVAMDPATLTTNTFKLTSGAAAQPVPGTVTYANSIAVFTPNSLLATNTSFTATVTTGVKSAVGLPLASNRTWTFKTGVSAAANLAVNLGTAGNFVILAKSGISTVPASNITGNIAVSPADVGRAPVNSVNHTNCG